MERRLADDRDDCDDVINYRIMTIIELLCVYTVFTLKQRQCIEAITSVLFSVIVYLPSVN